MFSSNCFFIKFDSSIEVVHAFELISEYRVRWKAPGGSAVKNPPADAGDVGLIPGWGRTPGKGNGNPLQYSCLEKPTDRGAWQVTAYGTAKELDTT